MWPFKKKEKEPTMLDLEEQKLLKHLSEQTPGTDAYDRAQEQLAKFQTFTGRKVEQSQKLTKEARGKIWERVAATLGTGALLGGMFWMEHKKGMSFSGANEKVGSGLLTSLGRMFLKDR